MHKVSPSLERGFESYEERQLAHAMMRNPRRPLDLDAFSQGMRIQSIHAEKMMDALREKPMRDFATSSGSFVSGRESRASMVDGEVDLRTLGHHLNLAIDCSALRIWRVPRPPSPDYEAATPNRRRLRRHTTGTASNDNHCYIDCSEEISWFYLLDVVTSSVSTILLSDYYDYDIVVAGRPCIAG